MKTKQYIDNSRFIEIVSDLADQIVEATFGEYTWVYDKENEEHKYSKDAQDLFNDKYDEIEGIFNVSLNIYSK